MGVSNNFQGCFKEVRVFSRCLRLFHESFMEEEVSWMFQGCFMIFKDVL